jgi:glutamate N-acetyltransferase/amino-acid N-acetyltransferase
MDHLKGGKARAIVVNSGNANTCNGEAGQRVAYEMGALAAAALGIPEAETIVASTGVIGVPLDIEIIRDGIAKLPALLSPTGSVDAREAIMTTDTIKKDSAVEVEIGGKTVTIGAIAKGSGMIHPNMATLLCFVTTDCAIDHDLLQEALSASVRKSFNRVSVDGDTSTNDMIAILANGQAGNAKIEEKGTDYRVFADALDFVTTSLAKLIARDGEGATRLIECTVSGASSEEAAEKLARSVISSNQVKAACFGADANWGRVLCALGYADVPFDPEKVEVSFEGPKGFLQVCKDGAGVAFSEETAKSILGGSEISILVDLHDGNGTATAWGCDLTYEYVRINGDYRT